MPGSDTSGAPFRWQYQNWKRSTYGATPAAHHIFAVKSALAPQGAWQIEEQVSDGTLRLMGLLWAAMEKEGPLRLEDLDLSLHPEIVRALPQMLTRVQRRTGKQTFLRTYSLE